MLDFVRNILRRLPVASAEADPAAAVPSGHPTAFTQVAPVAKAPSPVPVDIDALLGRPAVSLDTPELQRFLAGKVILVTGAGGSIGSEICRQMMRFCPGRLVLLDQAENALFEIDRELRERWVGAELVPVVADIGDTIRINNIFRTYRPEVVFHAAAHKHVPMMECNPGEAVKNNVLGTRNVADAALANGTAAFVLISTDKAVNPTSVMGAAKRCAELYVQSLNGGAVSSPWSVVSSKHSPAIRTRFVAVRFGNVLGSSGSVVPIFQKQIAAGGPVTVTHPDMKRFFMTIPEAAQLVMQAAAIAKGGEIFVLDMGQPVRILDLAREMIRRSGLVVDEDIQIVFSGTRPGEKLYEELANDTDRTAPTSHNKIGVWELPPATAEQAHEMIRVLSAVTDASGDEVRLALKRFVPEYQSPALPVSPMRVVCESAAA
ncbi:MAG: nucleoside-diphosphate sugar epimerase/dehydratase [Tepidisphaeraceae bacterium]|jgi:FlaA1/EpsC-like NDP-sugar epimerase